MRMKTVFWALASGLALAASASEVVSTNVWSAAMKKSVPVTVVLPDAYRAEPARRWPVAYLLHGHGGNDREFLEKTSVLRDAVDQYGFIGVCPDGKVSSWWLDSPVDPTMRYATFVTDELVPWADKALRTIPERGKRVIGGASMGGYGAMTLGCRRRDLFGAIGSIHGGVELRPFCWYWQLKDLLGSVEADNPNWERYSALTAARDVKNGELEILMVIGTADQFFLPGNRKLHELFILNDVAHTYVELRAPTLLASQHNFTFQNIGERWVYRFFAEVLGNPNEFQMSVRDSKVKAL